MASTLFMWGAFFVTYVNIHQPGGQSQPRFVEKGYRKEDKTVPTRKLHSVKTQAHARASPPACKHTGSMKKRGQLPESPLSSYFCLSLKHLHVNTRTHCCKNRSNAQLQVAFFLVVVGSGGAAKSCKLADWFSIFSAC